MGTKKSAVEAIQRGETSLGIELGSTRIKAVLIGEDHKPLASGSYDWENQYVDQIWTYSLEAISDYIEACRFSGNQRNDAWVYGI